MRLPFRFLLIVFLFQSSFLLNAQSCFDEIKDVPVYSIPLRGFNPEDVPAFRNNLMCLTGDELDSIDIELLFEVPIFNKFCSWFYSGRSNPSTYGEIYLFLIETKNNIPEYASMRELCAEKLMVYALPAVYSNWEIVRDYFLKLEHVNDQELEPTRIFFKANQDSSKTVYDVISAHQEYQMEIYRAKEKDLNKQFEEIFATSRPLNLDSLINKSKTESKPILLYFTGYNVVNARWLEQNVLKDEHILNMLQSDFIFCPLYVDHRKSLKESDWVFYKGINKTAKTIGEVNFYYQTETFQITNQPYFAALNDKQDIIHLGEYDDFKSSSEFKEFLERIISNFED